MSDPGDLAMTDNAGRDGEAKPFTSAASGEDEGIQTNDVPIKVDERTSAVSSIDCSVCLYVHQRQIRFGLSPD